MIDLQRVKPEHWRTPCGRYEIKKEDDGDWWVFDRGVKLPGCFDWTLGEAKRRLEGIMRDD